MKKLEDNPIKIYLKLYLKYLQNWTLSYYSMFSKQTYPKNFKKIMTLEKKKKKKASLQA